MFFLSTNADSSAQNLSLEAGQASADAGKNNRLMLLSLLIWPIVFVALALHFAPNVPMHYEWDNFSYLRAAKLGSGSVGLGMGRTLFCWMGEGFERVSSLLALDPLFGTFRVWVVALLFAQAVTLFLVGCLLARRVGLAAAHVFCAIMACHAHLMSLFLANWPENPAMILFFATAFVLCTARLQIPLRLVLGLVAAILMILMKEISVYFIPAFAILIFGMLSGKTPMAKRLGITAAWCLMAFAIPMLTYKYILPSILPGLGRKQERWQQYQFTDISFTLGFMMRNLGRVVRDPLYNPAIYIMAGLGFARFVVRLVRRSLTPAAGVFFSFAAASVVIPLVMIVTLGVYSCIPRYATAIIPGLGLMGAFFFMKPLPKWLGKPASLVAVTCVVCVAILLLMNWSFLESFKKNGRMEAKRYRRMAAMSSTPMFIIGCSDSWPAHYIRIFAGKKEDGGKWIIQWPNWNRKKGDFEMEREEVFRQAAAGRRIAIGPDLAKIQKTDIKKILKDLAPLRFKKDACGWWVSSPVKKQGI